MVIYGMSPSTSIERRLLLERAGAGVSLRCYDHPADVEHPRVVVPYEELVATVISPSASGSCIAGTLLDAGAAAQLDVSVRRNEVQIKVNAAPEREWDIAVGLDDFQDALEAVAQSG